MKTLKEKIRPTPINQCNKLTKWAEPEIRKEHLKTEYFRALAQHIPNWEKSFFNIGRHSINTIPLLSRFMKVHRLGGVGFDANVFLVEAEKPILIDAGTGRFNDRVIERIKGMDLNPISRIILTHRHFDHTGGAAGLGKALDASLFAHVDAAPPLISGDQMSTGAASFGGHLNKLDITVFKDGDVIDCEDVKLKIIHTPGHTIGSVSLYHADSRSLFSGDTVFCDGGVGRWDLDTGNLAQLTQSIKMLSEMDIVNLYPGHGPVSEGDGLEHVLLGLRYLKFF